MNGDVIGINTAILGRNGSIGIGFSIPANDAKLVIVDLEVRLGEEVRSAPTLCAKYKGKIIPLNTAHDGRPILMKEENSIEN